MKKNSRRLYQAQVKEAKAEAPDKAWLCPECRQVRPAGTNFCMHTGVLGKGDQHMEAPELVLEESIFSQDMRPRLRRR